MSRGSQTAKDGFANESDVVRKFNEWKVDEDARAWLSIMQYDLDRIDYVKAVQLSGYKTDVQVQVTIKMKDLIDAQNLQVKLVSQANGFNQVDKRWVDKYREMWSIPDDVLAILKHYTGEYPPFVTDTRDPRRMLANEFAIQDQTVLIAWITDNKYLIISDIMKGRGHFAAEWVLVAQKMVESMRWVLTPMNVAMNYFSKGDVSITSAGNVKIGRITMQRKGGDSGRETAKMLQFKLNPAELFTLTNY